MVEGAVATLKERPSPARWVPKFHERSSVSLGGSWGEAAAIVIVIVIVIENADEAVVVAEDVIAIEVRVLRALLNVL